jgi:3-methyl-2-oxobutanoate hydroxymethyltransferase
MSSSSPADAPMTVPKFAQRKRGEPLCVLTAYDYPFARIFDEAGVDALLVGDSLGTVLHGEPNTLGVTMDEMVYHARLVAKGAKRALVIADLPFMSYQADSADAVRNAGRLLKEACVHAVKLEGGSRSAATIAAVVRADIPVMGHIGMTPQSVQAFGGFKVQRGESKLLDDAKAVEDAGAFGMVLEGIPSETARKITEAVSIPTIGIGAGSGCDGQVLVWSDALGLTTDFQAKFVKRFAELRRVALDGAKKFCEEVRARTYPDSDHSYR